jgi:hypothetical protein
LTWCLFPRPVFGAYFGNKNTCKYKKLNKNNILELTLQLG